MKGRALWTTRAGECQVREEEVSAGAGCIVVRTVWSGISRGTESLVAQGRVPESERERMRGPRMGGSFEFPVKYGYSSVGVVEAGGDATEPPPGTMVFCLHPHQDLYAVEASGVRIVPASTPPHRAVLAPNMETAINVVWDAGVGPGDRVCVVGGGVVGLLIAYVCARIPGASVALKDPQDRREQCEALGLVVWTCDQCDFDVVVHASGNPAGLADCLPLAGDEALVVEASWHGDRPSVLHLGQEFHSRRLTIKSSQVGQLPPNRRPRWDYNRRLDLALALCADERLDCLLEDPPFHFDDPRFPHAYAALLSKPNPGLGGGGGTGLCYRVKYGHPYEFL